jgi:hypothetical protein
MLHGVKPSTFFVLPMLGKHPDEYPRFRDCFLGDEENDIEDKIIVYTRTGGGNREAYEDEIAEMQAMPTYLQDYDDSFDSTYACFVYDIPEEFKADFDLIMKGRLPEISETYKAKLYEVFPKLKEQYDGIFNPKEEDKNDG